jgi:hypothetical protein
MGPISLVYTFVTTLIRRVNLFNLLHLPLVSPLKALLLDPQANKSAFQVRIIQKSVLIFLVGNMKYVAQAHLERFSISLVRTGFLVGILRGLKTLIVVNQPIHS